MESTLMIVLILMLMIIGLLIFNYKLDISMLNMAYMIAGVALFSMILLMLTYNNHPECNIINFNNVSLKTLQETCYQYIDI